MRAQINKLVGSGMPQKDAIAKALSMKRRAKKMAEGGEVESGMDSYDDKGVSFSDDRDAPPEENGPWPGTIVMKKADGGMIEDEGSAEKSGEAVYPEEDADHSLSENVLAQELLAQGLQARKMKANDNTNSYDPFPGKESGKKMNQGGLLVEDHVESDLGNKPDLDWIDDGTEAPMATEPSKAAKVDHSVEDGIPVIKSALSAEAMTALAEKKKKRRFM